MADFPYHVAGGSFTPSRQPLQLLESMMNIAPVTTHETQALSRRRKLWEVPHKFHCPVIGTCFDVAELRGLMKKVMHFPADTTDFVLHTTAVGSCEVRSKLAELLQKQLEKRFHPTIRRFAAAKEASALRALWREATSSGIEIPAALWATWTHPACDSTLEHEVYADIHMIQHQVGTGARADLKTLKALKAENLLFKQQLEKARQENEALRQEKSTETQALGQRIIDLRAELAGRDATIANQAGQLDLLRNSLPNLKDRQSLLRRASDAEARCTALTAEAERHETEIWHLRQRMRHAEETINQLLAEDGGDEALIAAGTSAPDKLAGKCVLCVGGRTGAVDAYRQVVEQSGGRFMHHDGGLEESLHRIDSALSAADVVICQAGCISHNAYWRVKEQCRRTGKPCLFVRNSGVSSFGRAISQASTME
jgi:hypothetical protein